MTQTSAAKNSHRYKAAQMDTEHVCEVMDTVLVCGCVSGHMGATCTYDTLGLELALRWSEWLLPGESEAELQFILDARTIVPKH